MRARFGHHAIRVLQQHIAAEAFTGAGLAVWRHGEMVLEHYAGSAAYRLAAGPDILWPVASISKVYTAAAIMRLVEEGVLTLSTPVHLLLPDFKGHWRDEMRLRHLLTHTAGFIYEPPQMEERLAARTPLPHLVNEALASALVFRPGTALRYADNNYLVAGRLAEVATGESLPDIVRGRVLDAAGLSQTFFPPGPLHDSRIAVVRGVAADATDGSMYNSRYARALAHPAFGVVATTIDLARFGSMFMPGGPRFLSEGSVQAMTTDQTGGVPGVHPSMQGYAADVRVPWAIGFALQSAHLPGLYSDLSSPRTFGHGGASGCVIVCDPECGVVVALTTNTHLRTGREPWTRRIQSIVNCVFAEVTNR
jgi:CubicO group peptidase (beta-lactamase class C family)